jgi:hypothetical protein
VRKEVVRPTEFLKTIYVGDRACKSIAIDGWNGRGAIQVDEISRIRSASGQWEYYNGENIVDGLLVFTEVKSISFDPPGPVPNDYINDIKAEPLPDDYYRFKLSISSVTRSGESTEVIVTIDGKDMHLEDPRTPGLEVEN